jgi:hypothetical protein
MDGKAVPGTDGGSLRMRPSTHGEAVLVDVWGPKGGFRGGTSIDLSTAGSLLGALELTIAEAEQRYDDAIEGGVLNGWPWDH